ncbi:hypothetical protein K457DRAFT_21331 [Linnemannia elongata AG-77]|uniref:Uncharacterized protein n=1 Tax=Linnemannia elongata AG-77 TaxID=1314771 RepID=A0A197JSM5_9FUNG|nr:hypothetical protein K457DRAFT_21331 [Linnemannia elongata AG-77]
MNAPARKSTLERRVQADVPLTDAVLDYTHKPLFLTEPPCIVPSQEQQEAAGINPPQDPFACQLSHWIYRGDYVAILEYSLACTGRKALNWKPKSHMVELGSHFEIPELNHLGRMKRIAVVSQRYIVELSNASLPYLPFCNYLDRLTTAPTTADAEALSATLIQTPVDAFPENVRRIICSKAVHSDTGKSYPEIDGLCVLEYELFTPPAVQSPIHSPSFPPNSASTSSSSSSSSSSFSSSSSSVRSQSPPPTRTSLTWKAKCSYTWDVSSTDQEYTPASATGDRSGTPHTLTLNFGTDNHFNSTQSFFALEQPTGCCRFQGHPVTRHNLLQRHKLIFKGVKYFRQAQKSARKPRVKAISPPGSSELRPILPAIALPNSIIPDIFVPVRNSNRSSSSSAGESSSTSSASGPSCSSGASWSPSSIIFDASASSSSASALSSASAIASASPPPPRSPTRRRRRRRGRSPSSCSSPGKSQTA